MLEPLLIPSCSWTDVALDFVISLPIKYDYSVISMVIDMLTKKRYYLLYETNKNNVTREATTQLLF